MTTTSWLSRGQPVLVVLLAVVEAIGGVCDRTFAQVTPDTTLGAESSVVTPDVPINNLPSEIIEGGAIRGANLFHSFEQFNISEGQAAYFTNPAGIERIFSRVTGNTRSEIFGTLGILGNADLFLINPNGITFGRNASLNVSGSFLATTASSIQFGDRSFFSATAPQNNNLLDVAPSALFFNAVTEGSIINYSQAQSLAKETNSFGDKVGLQVAPGQTLSLVGGDLDFQGGNLTALEGKIALGSVAPSSSVSLNQLSLGILGYDGATGFRDIKLSAGATVDASNGGSIQVRGDRVNLTDAAKIVSQTQGERGGGVIDVSASQLKIQNEAVISTSTFDKGAAGNLFISADNIELIGSGGREFLQRLLEGTFSPSDIKNGLFTVSFGNGAAGNLTINTQNLVVKDGAEVSSSTYNRGAGGNINIRATDSIQVNGALLFAGTQSVGNGGNLNINTKNLAVQNLGTITTDPFAQGKGGNLNIDASESVEVIGSPTNDAFYVTGIFSNSLPLSEDIIAGNSGDLTINTSRLIVKDGGEIGAGTFGNGQGGNLTINATDRVEVIGVTPDEVRLPSNVYADTFGTGNIGKLTVSTQKLIIRDGGQISATTFADGKGGNLIVNATELEVTGSAPIGIDAASNELFYAVDGKFPSGLIGSSAAAGKAGDVTINTDKMAITDGAQVTANSTGTGNAGNINMNVNGTLQVNNGTISTSAERSSGGAIAISAGNIRLFGDSDITTDVFSGVGGGGNITLKADSVVAFDDSDILAFSVDGSGGNITLNTPAFLGWRERHSDRSNLASLEGNNRVDLNASGQLATGTITLPDVSFLQNSLTELPENLIDTNTLLANSCISRTNRRQGSFIITGSGNLPVRPGDASTSPYPTGTVRSVPRDTNSNTLNTTPAWKQGDPIVEPQGVYRLADGQLVLSRNCR